MLDLSLDDRTFRANPNFSLVAADRLPERLRTGHRLEGSFGLFIPKQGPDKQARTFCATSEAALLYLSLRRPARLPFHVRSQLDVPMSDRIGHLVLAGVLDVDCGGEFVTGFRAIRFLEAASRMVEESSRGGTPALSEAALDYAYRYIRSASRAQDRADVERSAIHRLYQFNAVPPSRAWRERITSNDSVLTFLRIDSQDQISKLGGGKSWTFHPADRGGWWHHWQPGRTDTVQNSIHTLRDRTWGGDAKLYISPVVAELPDVVEACLRIVRESPATGMKIGANIAGLFRPDKMVAYFANPDDLLSTAAVLGEALRGVTPQGVPFTADLTGDGLLSWGSDTPADESSGRRTTSSWRVWISEVLGEALVTASSRDYSVDEARDFAKTKAEFAGIDTTAWRPKEHLLQTPS